MNLIKKLCLYSLDCIKSSAKNNAFNNLKANKDNKIYITNETTWQADNKDINNLMMLSALNKNTMSLIYGFKYWLQGTSKQGNIIYNTPLLYCDNVELIRQNDNIILNCDFENNIQININAISSLLDNDADIVENIINQLLNLDNLCNVDFKKILYGLIGDKLDGLEIIKNQNALILAKMPESVAGLINELKQISEMY